MIREDALIAGGKWESEGFGDTSDPMSVKPFCGNPLISEKKGKRVSEYEEKMRGASIGKTNLSPQRGGDISWSYQQRRKTVDHGLQLGGCLWANEEIALVLADSNQGKTYQFFQERRDGVRREPNGGKGALVGRAMAGWGFN